jgi:transposase-like protein
MEIKSRENMVENGKRPVCKACKRPMYKWGSYASGKQKWHCPICGKAFSKKRQTYSLRKDILNFLDWILNKDTAARSTDKSRTTFYRINRKFWQIEPSIPVTGEIYKALIVDAKFLSKRLSVLAAVTSYFSVAYRWSDHGETTEEYIRLLSRIPQPSYVVCDGNRALLGALKRIWSDVRIQRCFFHLERYVEYRVGKKPETKAGIELKRLLRTFMAVKTKIGAKRAEIKFWQLFEEYKPFIAERVYCVDGAQGKSWWYAHKKLHSAWNHIANVIRDNQLWWWLDDDDVPRTTNDIEGGYNARIAELLRCHRGINRERQKRIVEWYLLSRSELGIERFLDDLLP